MRILPQMERVKNWGDFPHQIVGSDSDNDSDCLKPYWNETPSSCGGAVATNKKFVLLFKMFEATFCVFLFRGTLTHWLTKRHCFAARPFFIVDRNVAKRGVDFYWVPWGLSQNHMMLGWAIRLDYDPSLRFFIVIRVWRHCACVTMHWTKALQHSQRNITDAMIFPPSHVTSCLFSCLPRCHLANPRVQVSLRVSQLVSYLRCVNRATGNGPIVGIKSLQWIQSQSCWAQGWWSTLKLESCQVAIGEKTKWICTTLSSCLLKVPMMESSQIKKNKKLQYYNELINHQYRLPCNFFTSYANHPIFFEGQAQFPNPPRVCCDLMDALEVSKISALIMRRSWSSVTVTAM